MARRIPFSLKMADGAMVRTIEELREHFDLAAVLGYYEDGRLCEWLTDRYYDEEADKVRALDRSSEDFKKNLCGILGVPYSEIEADKLDIDDIAKKQKRREWLKQYTTDDAVLAASERVVFTQNELENLLDKDVKEIYLCGYKFIVPGHRGGITYKGVNRPCPIVEFDGEIIEPGIDLVDLEFDIGIYIGDGSKNIKFYRIFDKNRILGIKLLHMEAEKGTVAAQILLGACYRDGFGVKKDFTESVKMFRRAAEQGCAEAQYWLGECYYSGEGIDQDRQEAVKWHQKAAEQGHVESQYWLAQYWLGYCYGQGSGLEQNRQEAVKWYRKAAEQGHAESQYWIGDKYEYGADVDSFFTTNFGIEKNVREAVKWYRKAAEQGHVEAQYRLGHCYGEGGGLFSDLFGNDKDSIEKNTQEAAKWYRKAAEQGYADAQYELGMCYWRGDINGEGSESSKEAAIKWLKKAAEQGNKSAQDILK